MINLKENVFKNRSPKVALVEHPRPRDAKREEDVVNSPLSACLMTGYAASVLKEKGIEVEIVDANLLGRSIDETIEHLSGAGYALICVRLVYLWERTEDILNMIGELRKRGVKAHINLYGHYATFARDELLDRFPFVDSVAVGEPEFTLLELAERLVEAEQEQGISNISGLAVRDKQVAFKPRELISNLDMLPFPDRPNIEIERAKGTTTYILGSRGCYNNCGFCYLNPFYGDEADWRGRSAQNIFDEIKQLYGQRECRSFYFADANFFGKGRAGKERVKELANLIIESGIKIIFGLECRANDVDAEIIGLLKKAGLDNIFIGIESGDQAILNSFGKNTSVEVNKKAINIIRKSGASLNMGFIMFGRSANIEGIKQNFNFLQDMGLLVEPYTTAHLLHHRQSIFQGTPDYEKFMAESQAIDNGGSLPFGNYEALLELNDKRTAVMADVAFSFCRKALSIISGNGKNNEDDLCGSKITGESKDGYLAKLNGLLIDLFSRTLDGIEKGDIDLDDNGVNRLKEAHINEIESFDKKNRSI